MHATEITWSDSFLVGFDAMDTTHREFVELIRALDLAEAMDVSSALRDIEAHCEKHFCGEEGLMLDSDYPSLECHAQEHAAVLASVREVQLWWQPESNLETVRRLALALSQWFESHTAHLDSALSQWLVKRQYGGTPLVLRRSVAVRASGEWQSNAD
jgi:hemerythrin